MSSTALGGLLARKRISERMPVGELIDGMRCLYAMLQWTLRRIAGLVRARAQRATQAAALKSAAHAPVLAASCGTVPRRCCMHGRLCEQHSRQCASKLPIVSGRRTSVPADTPAQGGC